MKRLILTILMLGCLACRPATLAERVQASLVRVTSVTHGESLFGSYESATVCSGFMVKDETVLTANHCVGQEMLGDGLPTHPIKADQYYDLALIKVGGLHKPILRLSPLSPYQGQTLMAVGYGFGWDRPLVNELFVSITSYSPTPKSPVGLIMQGNLVGGMSGGPIVDIYGNVVAVSQQAHEGMAFGVGVTLIRAFMLDAGVIE